MEGGQVIEKGLHIGGKARGVGAKDGDSTTASTVSHAGEISDSGFSWHAGIHDAHKSDDKSLFASNALLLEIRFRASNLYDCAICVMIRVLV